MEFSYHRILSQYEHKIQMKRTVVLCLLSIACFSCQLHTRDKLHFEKIVFHSSPFSAGPFIDLEIDSDRTVIAKRSFDVMPNTPDSLQTGNFKGRLSEKDYRQLIDMLQSVDINTLEFPKVFCCDNVITTIIVYYNHKRKYLRSMEHPRKADELISWLMKIEKDYPLIKTTHVHKIENEF